MPYDDEAAIKTTLVNGKVRIAQLQVAKPNNTTDNYKLLTAGQQAQIPQHVAADAGSNSIKVIDMADTEEMDAAVAWKNGRFQFTNADVETVMREISRWYDVTIEYAGKIPAEKFEGEIPRSSNITEVFKILELSNVHCKIAGRKITVLP
jgi:ferric-dicitrate binding protein FerR (iron transport regulator)